MACILAPRSLPAQDAPQKKTFAELTVDKAQQSKNERKVRDILRKPKEPIDQGNIELLENYLRRYFFARMTREATFTELPQYREETRERCGWTASKDSAAGEEMNRITSSLMHALCNGVLAADTQQVIVLQGSIRDQNDRLRIVRSKRDLKSDDQIFNLAGDPVAQNTITELAPSTTDFHPAVKLNAMLVLGDLNDVQPRGRVEAKPRVNTQRDLIAYLESPEKLSETLLVGALSGLQRHAHDALDPNRKARIAKVVANLADAKTVSGRNAAAGLWIRRQAIDLLGQLGLAGERNIYVGKLYQIIRNQQNPLAIRVAAADALRKIDLTGLPAGVVGKLAQSLTQLAVDTCKTELTEASTPRRSFSADRLRMRLATVRQAVTGGGEQAEGGLMAVATEEEQKTLQELINVLQTVETQVQTLNAASNREQIEFVLGESVRVLSSLTPSDSDKKEKPTAPQTAEKS